LLLLGLSHTKHPHVDEAGFAALHYAAVAGDVAVLQGLLDEKADVNSGTTRADPEFHVPGKGDTALHLCAMFSRDEHALEFLLAQRADASIKDTFGCTALHMSCISGNRNAARVLLAHGCDPRDEDCMGGTPLLITSIVGKTGPVDDLLKAAGDVNMLTRQSHNAFHMACATGGPAMVKFLLSRGAEVDARIQVRTGDSLYMISTGASVAYRLGFQTDLLARYLHHMHDMTPLMVAAHWGHLKTVKLLLRHAADPTLRNCRHLTALELAQAVDHTYLEAILSAES